MITFQAMPANKKGYIETSGVDQVKIVLRPGNESMVRKAVIENFIPRFAPASILLHIKNPYPFKSATKSHLLEMLRIPQRCTENLPDLVLYDEVKGWLFLIEAVHSYGPISENRLQALTKLCAPTKLPLVFVTAFLDRKAFRKYAPDIAWDTEVWIAQEPDHMIHFNGDRFFGPR